MSDEIKPVEPAKPDAILFPASLKEGPNIYARQKAIAERFGPVLGGNPTVARVVGHGYMAMLDPERVSYERCDWRDNGDGIHYGYLKPIDES